MSMKPLCFLLAALVSTSALAAKTTFPAPKDAIVSVVGDNMVFNGVNLSAWELRSERSPVEVLSFYRDYWAKSGPGGTQGYAEKPFGDWRIITHVEDGNVYTVQVKSGESKRGTLALLGITDLADRKPTDAHDLAKDFPRPAGSVIENDIAATDQGVQSRTIVMHNDASPRQNLEFYLRHFQQNGWELEQGMQMKDNDNGVMVATRDGARWQLTFTPLEKSTYMVAVLEER